MGIYETGGKLTHKREIALAFHGGRLTATIELTRQATLDNTSKSVSDEQLETLMKGLVAAIEATMASGYGITGRVCSDKTTVYSTRKISLLEEVKIDTSIHVQLINEPASLASVITLTSLILTMLESVASLSLYDTPRNSPSEPAHLLLLLEYM